MSLADSTNGLASVGNPIQLALPLPHALQTRIQLHLTILEKSILLFATTASSDAPSSGCALGSFVYALPDRTNPSAPPISTALYPQSQTLDFATRLAKVLARKTGKPTYVGNSVSFSAAGRGGDVEEEMDGFRRIVEVVMAEVEKVRAADK
ncbi:hypothetical protein EJ06DRAFT_484381 [Trichodelitschia bisporula]|uniref:Proteasome assembly chaperone 3 n=1 Tax=Trichodelitschia bisporula TaxID=703511 RepID=A0A6G1HIR3_9PEZI|nr:hypothetical protein EJ06DRAFT_484381 [Trichodelitschia bisporula]